MGLFTVEELTRSHQRKSSREPGPGIGEAPYQTDQYGFSIGSPR